MTSNVHELKLT